MTDLHLSLDEIIKKRNIKTQGPRPKTTEKRGPVLKRLSIGPVQREVVKDARLKLQRKQAQRSPNTPDARLRLEMKRKQSRALPVLSSRLGNPLLSPSDPYGSLHPLVRTIDNGAPFFPRRPFDWDRPAEDDEMDIVPPVMMRPRFQPATDWGNISITVQSNQQQTPGILKKPLGKPINVPQRSGAMNLSERFNRDRSAEAAQKIEALKAQLKAAETEKPPPAPKPELGHRLIVSNLAKAVTQEDVKELFADIGELISSKLIHPSVAEVVYRDYEDAQRAVEVYHCRQLDGQPMICHLVSNPEKKTPRANVELNMTALRNALHKKAAS